jgi:hypothetical protein
MSRLTAKPASRPQAANEVGSALALYVEQGFSSK